MKQNVILIVTVALLAGTFGWVLRGGAGARPSDYSEAKPAASAPVVSERLAKATPVPSLPVSEPRTSSGDSSAPSPSAHAAASSTPSPAEFLPSASPTNSASAILPDEDATVWELDPGVRVPAVIAEPDLALAPAVAAADEQILREFEEAIDAPANASNDVSEKSWNEALHQADGAYRALHGDAGFNTQGMKNALDAMSQSAANP